MLTSWPADRQFLVAFTIFGIIVYQNISLLPYIYKKINRLEIFSLLCITVSLTLKFVNYYLYDLSLNFNQEFSKETEDLIKSTLGYSILGLNVIFFIYWAYFFIIFIFQLLITSSSKLLKKICACQCSKTRREYHK